MCSRITHRLILLFSFITSIQSISAQSVSNEGVEFYAVFPTHVNAADYDQFNRLIRNNFAEYSIFITGKQPSSGSVTVGGTSIPFNLDRGNTVFEVKVPRDAAYINQNEREQVLTNRAIKVTVDPGKPKIVVYGHIFAGRRSAASLILPKEALGQEYFTMNKEVGATGDGGLNHIVVAAVDPDTKVYIQKDGIDLVPGGVVLKNTGDVYQYLSSKDLTGTRVFVDPVTSACKKFALFSGTTNSSITNGGGCISPNSLAPSSDPLYQQNYPVESWGKAYGFVPFSSISASGSPTRTNGNFVRVLAKENNTVVNYNGATVATLKAGEFYQTPGPVNASAFITATKPIAVAQYALSQACAGGGGVSDADMVILNPIEYNIKNITVYSSTKEAIQEQYINILIKTSAVSSFKINGVAPSQRFTALQSAPEHSYLQLNLNPYRTNSFSLSADEGFNAIAYGFGNFESYAYSAGTNLASSQQASAISTDTKKEIENACSKQAFNVKVTLTSPVSSLSWQFEENGPVYTPVLSKAVEIEKNGTKYYDYYYPETYSYPTAGQKIIKVIATYPSSGGCALGQQEIDLLFDVYDPPEAKFKMLTSFCANTDVKFTDESLDKGNPITSWHWDFGDGKTSEERNPLHTYQEPGSYPVKLLVKNSTSCDAILSQQTIVIAPLPTASLSVSKPLCNDTNITITDMSVVAPGSIAAWSWDFGDGVKEDYTTKQAISHKYASGGTYQISLSITSNSGCTATITQSVLIPTPSLELGDDLLMLKGGSVTFKVNAVGTNLKYKWSPSTGLERDDVMNPIASPMGDTKYTLTITSEEGCILFDDIWVRVVEKPVIRNTFTPNGDGVNDLWEIESLASFPDVRVDVFNRFGVKVYSSIGYANPWNGTFNGVELPVGTYYYLIDAKLGIPPYAGSVTILR